MSIVRSALVVDATVKAKVAAALSGERVVRVFDGKSASLFLVVSRGGHSPCAMF